MSFALPFETRFRRRFAEEYQCLGPEILGGLAAATGGLSASTVLPLVASLGTSLIGGQMSAQAQQQQRDQQAQQSLAQEQARNSVLQNFLQTQKSYQKDNENQLSNAITSDTKPKLAATTQAAVDSRNANADASVQDVIKPALAAPSPGTGSTFNQADLTSRQNAGLGLARDATTAKSTLGGYGDTNAAMQNSALQALTRLMNLAGAMLPYFPANNSSPARKQFYRILCTRSTLQGSSSKELEISSAVWPVEIALLPICLARHMIATDPQYASKLANAYCFGRFLPHSGIAFKVFNERLGTMNLHERNAVLQGMQARDRNTNLFE